MQIYNDFSTSVKKALEEIDPNYMEYPGVVICGTHSPHDVAEMTEVIKKARVTREPFLGICFGHQLAAIEYARNVLGDQYATSEEFSTATKANFTVVKLPELNVGNKLTIKPGQENEANPELVYESYWNNYAVKPGFEKTWRKADYFITCQYHPEYQSSKNKPHPLLVKFIEHAKMAM